MVTIEELKLGNRTLEALKFLLSQITELETTISQIDISEIKDANTLTKEQIATLQDVKNAVETINSDLSLKKSDFDEKKQNFDNNINAFKNDKADFDEKKADFDSKNSTALSNFAFITSNVEKINSVSALLAEAKNVLETIKPIEQRTQAALNIIANSQAKFAELDALKTTLLELKRSLENISTTGLINDDSASTTTTYSSTKINALTQGGLKEADASENNTGGKLVKRNAQGNIYATNVYLNAPTKAEVSDIKTSLATDKWRFIVRDTGEGLLRSMSIKDFISSQEVDAYKKSESDDKYLAKSEASTDNISNTLVKRGTDKNISANNIKISDTGSDIEMVRDIEKDTQSPYQLLIRKSKDEPIKLMNLQNFIGRLMFYTQGNIDKATSLCLKKTDKIDAYTKRESDEKFALKTELTDGLPIGAYLSYPSQKTIPAGFLIADGRSLKKAEYTELFDVIGYTYGGSGENFNLPNFADGKFMRSIGGNAAGLGVVQQDAIDVNSLQLRSIVTDSLGNRNVYGTTGNDYRAVQYTYSNTGTDIAYKSVAGKEDKPIFATSKPANENRPLNMSVVVLIKAKDVISPSAGQIDKSIIATEAKAGVVKLKNSITAQQEDAAVTEKAVSDLLDINKSIGVGQAYQDVWAQRELNTYYPNTAGRPIMVDFNLESTSGSYIFHIVVDDVVVRKIQSERFYFVDAQFIVPAGSKYKIATPENTALKKLGICNNTNASSSWSELK